MNKSAKEKQEVKLSEIKRPESYIEAVFPVICGSHRFLEGNVSGLLLLLIPCIIMTATGNQKFVRSVKVTNDGNEESCKTDE
uniref:Uncharacterized protein n=1 Tax=Lepeophtheirus salmonis TaxID=72036 RepID=A0A0K2V7N5_LEPSM